MGTTPVTSKKYYTISQGRVRRKSKTEEEGTILREKTDSKGKGTGEFIHEWVSINIFGILKNIRLDKHPEFGVFLIIEMYDKNEEFQIQVREKSAYARAIMTRLLNIDLNKEIKIIPYNFIAEDNKRKIGCKIEQDGVVIYPYYTKKNTDGTFEYINGYPNYNYSGNTWDQDEWDKYLIDVHKFLRKEMAEKLLPKLRNIKRDIPVNIPNTETTPPMDETTLPADNVPDLNKPGDDLPF